MEYVDSASLALTIYRAHEKCVNIQLQLNFDKILYI